MGGSPSEPPAMFSYANPPGASVAWPPRDERQGWHLPPTRGGRCGGAAGDPSWEGRGVTKTTEIGTARRPLRRVTLPARADGSPSAPRRGGRPRVPSPPDPAPSAHPGLPATNRRRRGARTARACPTVRAGRAAACLLGRRRCQLRDARHGRDVTRDFDGRLVGRVTGGDGRRTDGGETSIVINDVRRLRRGHGEHRLALTGGGPPCRATRSNRDFLLAITGIIAHKNQFRATSVRRESITP